jgi:hypothetical protein
MAVAFGKETFAQRAERKTFLAKYHSDDICGSSFHGLATTIQRLMKEGEVDEALDQIKRCIDARKAENSKRGITGSDDSHHQAVLQLEDLYIKIRSLKRFSDEALLTTLVNYSDSEHKFSVKVGMFTVGDITSMVAGKRKKKCRNGTRRNKKTGGSKKRKRCPNGTRKDKKTGRCVKKNSTARSSSPSLSPRSSRLSDAEIESIIRNTCGKKYDEYEHILRPQLATLRYDREYRSCFGEKLVTLYDQAVDRVECWRKYGAKGPI